MQGLASGGRCWRPSSARWPEGLLSVELMAMQEWTDDFITNAQQDLVAMVKDWKYDYGADDRHCSAMLLWMVLKLHPDADIDQSFLWPDPPSDGLT